MKSRGFPGGAYFAYTGSLIASILAVTYVGHLQQRPWTMLLVRDVMVITAVTVSLAGAAFAMTRRKFVSNLRALTLYLQARTLRFSLFGIGFTITFDKNRFARAVRVSFAGSEWFATAIYISTAYMLLSRNHRNYFLIVGALQACAVYMLRSPASWQTRIAFLLLGLSTWGLAAGLTFTNMSDWALNSISSSLGVVAFLVSFALVIVELSDDRLGQGPHVKSRPAVIAVMLILLAFAFRSDNLLVEWVPYHRSFLADIAQLVRDGHWVLWDFPSQYGFLSIVAIAAIPAKNAWQGLFILVALMTSVQSLIVFCLWRWGRSGWVNLIFSALVTLAAFGDSIARYPLDGRLYAAQGPLRTTSVLCLLGTVFLLYVWRRDAIRVTTLYCVGHCIWAISLLWSFEISIWATLVWVPYVLLAALTSSDGRLPARVFRYAWPLVAIPISCVLGAEAIYRLALGHGPDWYAYAEFTGFFLTGANQGDFPVNPYGAGWCVILVLGASGVALLAAIRRALWTSVPLLAATTLAVLAASTSYVVEPYDGRVAWTLCIYTAAVAIIAYVSRAELRGDFATLLARLSAAPIMIVSITMFLGSPAHFAKMTFPFMRGWTSDTLSTLPTIHGELADLIRRARIEPGSAVLIPSRPYWTEISQGILFPTMRVDGGGVVAFRSWVPLSPLGVGLNMKFLPAPRRQLYIERFLQRSTTAGWYIEYRVPASCEAISPRLITKRSVSSPNYSASLCELKRKRYAGAVSGARVPATRAE